MVDVPSMEDQTTVYKATYSNVPVYELNCKSVSVMRRREDDYINATQILKVAEFGKAQRTRILEREVQTGTHEKIQGGYGKYQGTWIPIERAKELARRYDVFELLSPLLLFQAGGESPPLAPKHTIQHHTRPKAQKAKIAKLQQVPPPMGMPMQPPMAMPVPPHHHIPHGYVHPYHYAPYAMASSSASSQPQTNGRSMVGYKQPPPAYGYPYPPPQQHQPPPPGHHPSHHHGYGSDDEDGSHTMASEQYENDSSYESDEPYEAQLLRHFISGDPRVPSLLMHPPPDLDFNIIIDDEGHTSLHWAAAMGHLKIVKLLLHHGADVYRVNYKGQTALIRAVLFTNNFERRCFPHMLELLRKTIFNIDKKDQTVFHHIASTAGWKGKVHASRYYMDCLMERIRATNKDDLVQILNVQDVYGDTALTIASRIGNKKLVRLLVDAGANPQLVNEEGKTSQDYILEMDGYYANLPHQAGPDEEQRKRARQRVDDALKNDPLQLEPPAPTAPATAGTPLTTATNSHALAASAAAAIDVSPSPLSPSSALHNPAPSWSSTPVLRDPHKIIDDFIGSFERDHSHKDQVLREMTAEVQMVKKRLDITLSTLNRLSYDKRSMDDITQQADALQLQLHRLLEFTQQKQLVHLVQRELDAFQKPLDTGAGPSTCSIQHLLSSSPPSTEPSSPAQTQEKSPSLTTKPSASLLVPDTPSSPLLKRRLHEITKTSSTYDLSQQWHQLRQDRQAMVKQIVQLQRQMPNKRYQDYKRLISMCCNVNYENVDIMLSPLLASFEQSEVEEQQRQQFASIP
ncbi:apses-domain-containing protein [Hesseltinella vesiculosa]|uniref:Apses-domain-containing protein n=1 Tax=Hesseltinella vesiculosa TaxID=101127 RepID=A0A1X2GAE0_9FUNG|nr:apses-domain-containing protein [Hesseltinella vesiculosa]